MHKRTEFKEAGSVFFQKLSFRFSGQNPRTAVLLRMSKEQRSYWDSWSQGLTKLHHRKHTDLLNTAHYTQQTDRQIDKQTDRHRENDAEKEQARRTERERERTSKEG